MCFCHPHCERKECSNAAKQWPGTLHNSSLKSPHSRRGNLTTRTHLVVIAPERDHRDKAFQTARSLALEHILNHEAPDIVRGVLLRYHSQGSQRVNRVYDVRLLTYVRLVYRSSRKKTQSSVRPACPFVVEETVPTRSRCSSRSLCHGNLLDYT